MQSKKTVANLWNRYKVAADNSAEGFNMAHVITNKCVKCKFTDCVEVCPVACFYELDNQLVIHPDDCIDCQACVSECPVEAIYAEADVPAEFKADIEFNAAHAKQVKGGGQEAIMKKKEPLPTAADRKKELGY
jgi:ferredoxin